MKNGLIIEKDGTKIYDLNGKYHRIDGPAIEYVNGTNAWYWHGEYHRLNGPAIEMADGDKAWYLYGKLHRVGKPAEEYSDGLKRWFLYGKQFHHPKEFETMEEFFDKLNTNEKYSLQFINDINGIIELIDSPTPKQKRLHAIKWKL